MTEKNHAEDIIVYKPEARRKTRLSIEDEFLQDLERNARFNEIKRRCLDTYMNNAEQSSTSLQVIQATSTAVMPYLSDQTELMNRNQVETHHQTRDEPE